MSSRSPQLLANVFSLAQRDARAFMHDLAPVSSIAKDVHTPPQPKRRTMIWDLHHSMHCSIIGTCLSTAELRRLLVKVNAVGAEAANEHDLHMLGVMLAGRPEAGAKVLQKTLDRRHETAIKQFARAKDAAALSRMWDDALKRGDIPGAYWATLTHPVATDEIARRVFGDVHMLSHLVGAANRADIRRLKILEETNAALNEKLERQQRQLRDGFVERDVTIRRLNAVLAETIARGDGAAIGTDEFAHAAKQTIADLERRLSHESSRRERLEKRVALMSGALSEMEQARNRAEHQRQLLADDLAASEQRLDALFATGGSSAEDELKLTGLAVLYVGGRANQVPQLKALVERGGGIFLHHDGGIEHSSALLPGLLSRADWTLFPVDCISHDAMGTIKRVCRQTGKQFRPLRTSSLTCALAELSRIASCKMQPAGVGA
jgi:hypothetical protein